MFDGEYLLPEEKIELLRSNWSSLERSHGYDHLCAMWGRWKREVDDYEKFRKERDQRYLLATGVYKDWDYWERGNLYLPELEYTMEIKRLELAGFRRYQVLKRGGADGKSCFYREEVKDN